MLNLPINILSSDFEVLLNKLDKNTKPTWGIMTAQHMLEHVVMGIKISNGSLPLKAAEAFDKLSEREQKLRIYSLESTHLFKPNTKSPVSDGTLAPLRKKSLEEARDYLLMEINQYRNYWLENTNGSFYQPAFGLLNKEQWHQFQNKHLYHHFLQFALIPIAADQ